MRFHGLIYRLVAGRRPKAVPAIGFDVERAARGEIVFIQRERGLSASVETAAKTSSPLLADRALLKRGRGKQRKKVTSTQTHARVGAHFTLRARP